ncbi:MAG: PD40 domain-containing protein [Sedimentisphaerales bacterium]|nr:PD40 domain-containing protein [Sedimentisphaerales bacterium]
MSKSIFLVSVLWVLVTVCSLVSVTRGAEPCEWTSPVTVPGIDTERWNTAAFLSFDGMTLYFVRQEGSTGPYTRIFQAVRQEPDGPFAPAEEIVALSYVGGHVSSPWVSPDNLRMYYYRTEAGGKRLKLAERDSCNAPWPVGRNIEELNAYGTLANPTLTADELIIVFSGYNLPGGKGEWDLWMASRPDRHSPFGEPTVLHQLNTASDDMHSCISADGLALYFGSKRNGQFQIFRSTRSSRDSAFEPPAHLAVFDNPDSGSTHPFISADRKTFLFTKADGKGASDIYVCYAVPCYYVDAAEGDDSNDGRSPETAFATVQKAIDVATDGEVVKVYPGVYREQLYFQGKAITVQAAGDAPVLTAPGRFAVSFYMGEGPDTILRNFVIANSYVGVVATDSSPTLVNLTVVGNDLGIEAYREAHPHVSNCILWGNAESDLYGCSATYSCVECQADGEGDFSADPLFVDPENGDYHLRSERGRYWPEHDVWVLDEVSSTRLRTRTGSVAVASVTRRRELHVGTVYNLVVPDSHQYLVGRDAVIARDY